MSYYLPPSQYSAGGDFPVYLGSVNGMYNKKGKLRKMFKTFPSEIEDIFNDLNQSLKKYVSNKKSDADKDDW